MAHVVIEVPEEMATLIEQDPLLMLAATEAVKKGHRISAYSYGLG